MTQNITSSHTPRLRFSEFSGNWEEKKLGEIGKNKIEKNKNNSLDFVLTNSASLGIVSQESFFDKEIANSNNTNGYYIVDVGDFVYNPRISNHAPYGPIKQNMLKKGIMSPLYTIFSIHEGNKNYYTHYFETTKRHKYLHNNGNSGARSDRLNISNQDFYNMPINVPTLPEQTKIASFLTAVDDKISNLTHLVSTRRSYKSGIMQQIFSQEIRFLDDNGQHFPDWEEKKLGEVFHSYKGQGLSKDDVNENGLNKCILYGELYTTYQEVIKEVKSKTDLNEGTISNKGDLLIPCSTTTSGIDLANVTELQEDGVLLGGDITILRFKNKGNSTFFAYYLTHYKKHNIARYAQGSTIVHLYYSHFKNINISSPSLPEQTKIANFLSQIDDTIAQLETQIETTKQWKKGLLQGLFI